MSGRTKLGVGKERPPLTFIECLDVSIKFIAANKIHHFQNDFSGNPYVGLRATEMKQKNDTISMLKKENKQLKSRIAQLEARYALFSVIMFMMTI